MTICDRTGLTKPECHCPTCISAMIAEHAPASRTQMQPTARASAEVTPFGTEREAA